MTTMMNRMQSICNSYNFVIRVLTKIAFASPDISSVELIKFAREELERMFYIGDKE
jgi:hypothetical protein